MPRHHLSRTLAALGAIAALTLTGCTATPTDDDTTSGSADGAFPVTIEHAFGETVLESEPERVVTLGWGSADAAIALGVIPVAMPFQSYAGDENGVLPWIADALDEAGAETPVIFPDTGEEPAYEEIAEADPDVILAAYSGITAEQYELLSEIAPVVAYPGEAWSTPWRDLIDIVGTALGRTDQAVALQTSIDDQLAAAADAHPEFAGQTLAAVWDVAGTFYVYKPEDPRVEFMLDLGFVSAPAVDELDTGEATFFYTLSYEQLDKLSSDVLVSYGSTQEEQDAFLGSTYAGLIPAVQSGKVASLVGTELISSVSPPTALSLTWGLDEAVSALAAAVAAD